MAGMGFGGVCQQAVVPSRCNRRSPLVVASSSSSSSTSSSTTTTTAAKKYSLHICTGKVCRKQGSQHILKFVKDVGLEEELNVDESGCLGNCGKGPNMVLMPNEMYLRHVGTVTDMVDILRSLNIMVPSVVLEATQLRLAGNALAVEGDLQGAVAKYNEALALNPGRGEHMLHANLSASHLQLGDKEAALAAAQAAVACAPKGFHMAYVRLVDALYALGRYGEAAAAMHNALARDHTFKSIPEYKVMERALRSHKQGVAA